MRMALVFCVLLLAAVAQVAFAEIPRTVSYQGVLMDTDNYPLADGEYEVTFRVYDQKSGGVALWTEVDSVTVARGIFDVILGKETSLDLSFDRPYWLSLEVEGGGELTPRVELTGSPYAFRAAVAESASVVAGGVGGGGTAGYIPKFAGSTTLENSILRESGNCLGVGLGPMSIGAELQVYGDVGLASFFNSATGTSSIGPDGLEIGLAGSSSLNGRLFNNEDGYLEFGTNGLRRMIINAEGRIGIGIADPYARLHVAGNVIQAGHFQCNYAGPDAVALAAEYNGTGYYNAKAVSGVSVPHDAHGTGGYFEGGMTGVKGSVTPTGSETYYGVQGQAQGGSGTNYGVEAIASGTGTNVGVYGEATGGAQNYAGYFFGAVRLNGSLWLEAKPAPPTPSGGFVIYVDSSDMKLKAKAATGTVTVLANP